MHFVTLERDSSGLTQSVSVGLNSVEPSMTVVEATDVGELTSTNVSVLKDLFEQSSLQHNLFQCTLVVYAYVARLSEKQVAKVLQLSTTDSLNLPRNILEELQTALIERLAILDPIAAMEFTIEHERLGTDFFSQFLWSTPQYPRSSTNTTIMPFVQSVFKEWALHALNDAVHGTKSLTEDARKNALVGILSTLSGESLAKYLLVSRDLGYEELGQDSYVLAFLTERIDDPSATWKELVKLVKLGNFYHSQVLENVARQWYKKEGVVVLEEISSGSLDEHYKNSVINYIMGFFAQDNPQEAFHYALTLQSESRFAKSVATVISIWAESDPQAAYDAAASIERIAQSNELKQNVVSTWASNEPHFFLKNLDTFPLELQEQGRVYALEVIARISPREAADLATNQKGRLYGQFGNLPSKIMRHWIEQDVEAAIDWVFNGPVHEHNRHTWVHALTIRLVETDPHRAFELALKQPVSDGLKGMYQPAIEAQLIDQIVTQNLELAVELLPRVREGNVRVQAYGSVGARYIGLGDPAKAIDLAKQLSVQEQERYFQSILYSWVRIDPDGLVESFKNIPTRELRSSLARYLSTGTMRENLTDTQVDALNQYLSELDQQALKK